VSGVHAHALHYHGHSPVHHLPPEVKLASMFLFVLAVVSTPREAVWAFSVHAAVVVSVLTLSRVPPAFFLRRILIEIPFVVFAILLPFLGPEPKVALGPIMLSVEGGWGAWNILAKATLGLGASVLLAATTEIPELLAGLDRLRMPRLITAIASFMVRYLEVVGGEFRRTRTAMTARGFDPRWLAQARPLAVSAGALFIRSYERGERVFQAMTARGFDGTMPVLDERPTPSRPWVPGLAPAIASWAVAIGAMVAV
jgi:cobalt/nickel transport system permease protein